MPSYCNGDAVDKYQVVKLLGRGAFGEVLLVRDAEKTFAMKVIPCDPGSSGSGDKLREGAIAEAQLLQTLRHPHIVACQEVAFDEENHIVRLVLEYMDGGDLQGLIESRRAAGESFDAHFARRLLAAVGGALFYVHSAGILHRDIKPANILLSKRSHRIKIADFGIAKLVEATTLKAQTVVGTPYYLSPEIVSGEEYGPASDSWALGACLYEIVMLRRPFEASNQLALVQKICYGQLEELPASTADDVRSVIHNLLEKDQHKRMSLADALSSSAAIAALVVSEPADIDAELIPTPRDTLADPCQLASSLATTDSWEDCKQIVDEATSLDPLGAATANARSALGAEVDDPEELQLALINLQRERSSLQDDAQCDSAAIDSLEDELRLRLGAMRCEAAALLDGIVSGTGDVEATIKLEPLHSARSDVPSIGPVSVVSTPRGHDRETCATEDAIEVATNLGVDTEPAEEHIASVRRMLSVRIVWHHLVRFCLLPVRARFDSLLHAVVGRFGLTPGSHIALCWCEGETFFPLDSQASWDECLQRRGLAEKPGRLELQVHGSTPPRKCKVTSHNPKMKNSVVVEESTVNISSLDFFVTGMQAIPAQSGKALESNGQVPRVVGATPTLAGHTSKVGVGSHTTSGHATKFSKNTTSRAQGKAWAAATGREQPVHWAPTPGSANTIGTRSPGLDLCLEGRAAATVRRQ